MKIIESEIVVITRYVYRMIWDQDVPPTPSTTQILKAWNAQTNYPADPPDIKIQILGEYECQKK